MAWPQDAYVGQKVVCIMCWPPQFGYNCPVKVNGEYEISSIYISDYSGEVCFTLKNIDPFPAPGFHHRGFRPIISRPTDISIFTAMLGPKQKEQV